MKIEEMLDIFDLDIFDIDEIEEMSPEECKGLLKGFFIGAGFIKAIDKGISDAIENRYKRKSSDHRPIYSPSYNNPYTKIGRQDFRKIRLYFQTRVDAQEVLDDLEESLEASKKGYVPVRYLYQLADSPTTSEMEDWVWYDLEDCHIERVNDDYYILHMPPAEYIRKKDRALDIS